MGKRKELSQAEIWDDSALLRSWDEALEEYKLYHSIHARGEKVEDVLREAEAEDSVMGDGLSQDNAMGATVNGQDHDSLEDGEVDDEEQQPALDITESHDHAVTSSPQLREQQQQAFDVGINGATQGNLPMPQAVIGGVQDEALKNLMMSWYFAGFYTGLYEGKQQAMTGEGSANQNGRR